MKQWLKRALVATMVLSLSATILAGCSTGEKNSSSTSGKDDTSSKTEGESSSTDEKKEHTLKMLGQEGGNQFIKFKDREEYPAWKELQKLLDEKGLKLEYELVPNEQYKVVIQTRMASGSNLPDIANISPLDTTSALTLAKQGVIQDITGPIEEFSDGTIRTTIEKYYPKSDGLTTAPDGKKYWFTNLHYKHYNKTEDAPVGLTMNIRKDWLEKAALEVPKTADEFYAMLQAFQEKDVNGSGAKDEVLVLDPKGFHNGIAQWFGLGIGVTNVDATNLKVVTPWYQDGAKDYFTYMQKLVKDGLLDTSGLANVGETLNQKRAENKLAADYTYGLEMWNKGMTPDPAAEYMPIVPLKSKDGLTTYASMEPNTLVWEKYAITKSCKDLEGAIKFFDVVHSERYIELLSWGIKDSDYEVNENGDNVFKDRVNDEEAAKQRRSRGNPLWGSTVFPIIQVANLEFELVSVPDFKKDYQLATMDFTPWYTTSNETFFAMPDDAQLEAKNKIASGINTYSEELATKLILGQESIDSWDKYMAKFKELGLDELVAIDQALVDKYQEILKK